ncbi:chorismate lyase [Vibrio sp. SS-MA-C1-2]|uniref:chorismate--pyruvate lyase family protein n=1 Tax=Vibrio sp. SS-MA-C1-2 TaxID=2908646 RepID=UPI001F01F4A7|nr:chorismate lyase [Vibrio sp. SS-MA-C1-2]UJF19289.1 chorismate lyase [Vibrio sp. SS-MA-C1-2]
MNRTKLLNFEHLEQALWCSAQDSSIESAILSDWLLDSTSLSLRLQKHCQHLDVKVINQQSVEHLAPNDQAWLGNVSCLVREVVISGDKKPWVIARTLIPHATLTNDEQDILDLGDNLLGLRIFSHSTARRDEIEVATILPDPTSNKKLWARRSRLWINNKPMLVAELFLPHAPIYEKDNQQMGQEIMNGHD